MVALPKIIVYWQIIFLPEYSKKCYRFILLSLTNMPFSNALIYYSFKEPDFNKLLL